MSKRKIGTRQGTSRSALMIRYAALTPYLEPREVNDLQVLRDLTVLNTAGRKRVGPSI